MADVRDIMDSRLRGYRKDLGILRNQDDITEERNISGYQKATISMVVSNLTAPVQLRIEGSHDGRNWFNLHPTDKNISIGQNQATAFTTDTDIGFIRVKYLSGGNTGIRIDVVLEVLKTIVQ